MSITKASRKRSAAHTTCLVTLAYSYCYSCCFHKLSPTLRLRYPQASCRCLSGTPDVTVVCKIQFVSLLIVIYKSPPALPAILALPSLTPSLLFCFYLTEAMSSYSYFSNQTQRYSAAAAAAAGNSSSGGSQVAPSPNGMSSGGSSGDSSIRPARTPSVSSWSRLSLSVANDKDGNGPLGGSAGTEGARSVHPLRST